MTPTDGFVQPQPLGASAGKAGPPDGFMGLLDSILRRREDFFAEIFERTQLGVRNRSFLLSIITLSAFYGLTMGASAFTKGVEHGFLQMLASSIKVPALYLLTLLVCYPVLFIILVLMGSKLTFQQTLAMILLALTLNSVLLASFAPIVLFFIVTGATYEFVKLLHVAIMGFSGLWAMTALWQGLREMCEKSSLYPKQAVRIMQVWILVFGFVGTQMAWSLRPFVGSPDVPFQVFRKQEGNFYRAIAQAAGKLARPDEQR